MDFFSDMDTTQKIVLGIALITLLVAVVLYVTRSLTKKSADSTPSVNVNVESEQVVDTDLVLSEETTPILPEHHQPIPGPPQGTGVLVMCFAPWCGHCKTLEPLWDELIQNFDGYNGIRIQKVNGQENPKFMETHQVQGFPTVKYCPHGVDNPTGLVYQGDRSMNSLIDFLQQCGTIQQ